MGEPRLIELVKRLPNPDEIADSIGVGEGLTGEQVIRHVHGSGLRHLVQREGLEFEQEVKLSELMIRTPATFLDHPLESIFGLGLPRQHFHVDVDVSAKKADVLGGLGDFVARVPGSRTVWDQALLIADELFTNGAKNGWNTGGKLFRGPPVRTGRVELFAEADQTRLILGARDTFGALAIRTVLARIWTCYEYGVASSIRQGSGGAGIGSYMVFDSCLSYYAGVEDRKRSVVCVALPLGLSRRAGSGLPKNIHLLS